MPQLQTFSLRNRSRLAQQSASKRRGYDSDSSGSDSENELGRTRRFRKKASLAAAAAAAAAAQVIAPPQYTMFQSYPGQVQQPMYRRRKKTALAVAKKPADARLASSRGGDSFFTVNLNLFTLLAIIGVVIVIILMFNMKNQMVGLENKIQVMCATM